jgi:tRNA pseudouridine38-40 synthase
MPAYALLLAYDGTGLAGWAGPGGVAERIAKALADLGEPGARVRGASRTDAGVHARGQVADVRLRREWEPGRLAAALNHRLPEGIACRASAHIDPSWSAPAAAVAKTYRYRLDAGPVPCADLRRLGAWRPPLPLDPDRLAACAALLPGTRDWAAFVRRGDERSVWTGTVMAAGWRRRGRWWEFTITGSGFRYRLVRSLVGGMVAVAGRGATPDAWCRALAGEPGPAARHQAPARGLHLIRIRLQPAPAWAAGSTAGDGTGSSAP